MSKPIIVFLICLSNILCFSQDDIGIDSTGLAGDNFSLQGALDLFSKATSMEEFERALNTESNYVNNLDLNEDGEIDYISVTDHTEGELHAITLQVTVSEKESQDIAVIEIEKNGEESAQIQIAGDEELYGENVFAEPWDEKAEGGKGGPSPVMETTSIIINVWFWPSVRFVYGPSYRPWVSVWRWQSYPTWWRPWRPFGWRTHWGHCNHYHTRYQVVHIHRCARAHGVYRTHRVTSAVVHNRYKTAHVKHNERKAAVKRTDDKASGKNEKVKKNNKAEKEKVRGNSSENSTKNEKSTGSKTKGRGGATNQKTSPAKGGKAGGGKASGSKGRSKK